MKEDFNRNVGKDCPYLQIFSLLEHRGIHFILERIFVLLLVSASLLLLVQSKYINLNIYNYVYNDPLLVDLIILYKNVTKNMDKTQWRIARVFNSS